ncbi:hypothetical protein MW871_09180 [Flavobacterium sp. I-SCBP12n]|uniref:Uncharacterized protein n=2 Tax=Flavobacterium TaxID=237 RepID=A0A9X1XS46_9FLAO|nr:MULTISPECIES: hypothetical protein [Flavobacterium]MBP4140659.1 hypothetical protein [Flavobacterium flabelliforme]MCK8142064.1 hypothetical protein [Flavobacterium pygoscelis]
MTRKKIISIPILAIVLLLFASCKSNTYVLTNIDYKTGVDFTNGKWLLNQLDSPGYNSERLTNEAATFFKDNLKDRYFYREDVSNLLIPYKIPLNPSKQKLQELKIGTGFDYFINISSKKNKDEIGIIGLYEDEYSTGANQSEVTLEIYDLNSQEIIYSQRAIGKESAKKEKSVWETQKSNKLIDNISFHRSSSTLMTGSLKKILKDLQKKSIQN